MNIRYFDKKIFENFASLSLLKASNLLLSWLLYPYIIRLIGIEHFGFVMLAQSVMLYFVVFTDYGFSLSAPREVARLHQASPKECSLQISDFFWTQVILGIVSFLFFVVLLQLMPFFVVNSTLFLYSFPIVIGQISFPGWFFQGIEKMAYITYLNLLAKLILIVGTVLCIRSTSDYLLVNFFWGIGNLVAGITAWMIIHHRLKFKLSFPNFKNIATILHRDFHLFVANLTNTLTFNSTMIILGAFANAEAVGLYSVAERIFMIARQVVIIVHQMIYPRVSYLAQHASQNLRKFFREYFILSFLVLIPISGGLFLFAPSVTYIFAGKHLPETTTFIQILSFTPLIATLNLPACQTLLVSRKEKTYTKLSLMGAVFHMVLSGILIYYYQGYGASTALLITETFLLIIFGRTLYLFWREKV